MTAQRDPPNDDVLRKLAAEVAALLADKQLSLVTAESCTAGLLAATLSQAEGASSWLHGGFVVYTKVNKVAALGLDPQVLRDQSAVCADVACALAEAALARSPADIAVALTGVAGPEPDEDSNPVGLVHIACARRGMRTANIAREFGNIGRNEVQCRAIETALRLALRVAAAGPPQVASSRTQCAGSTDK